MVWEGWRWEDVWTGTSQGQSGHEYGMLVYNEVTSIMTSRVLERWEVGKEQRIVRKWFVSLTKNLGFG